MEQWENLPVVSDQLVLQPQKDGARNDILEQVVDVGSA